MPDLMKEFLERTNRELADLDEKLPRLERNPADKDVWNALEKFFAGIRNTAPFLDMERSYRLSDAAFEEIMQYKDGEKGLEILPAVLMKFQRVKKIVVSVANLGREPRETDEDLLPDKKTPSLPVAQNEPEAFSKELRDKAEALKNKEKELLQQGAALDAREEELVVWSQDLSEQETFLKERENKLYDGEKRILVSENKFDLAFALNLAVAMKKQGVPVVRFMKMEAANRCETDYNWDGIMYPATQLSDMQIQKITPAELRLLAESNGVQIPENFVNYFEQVY